eukprot:CAMPEP_0174893488 /NCGR_PEP_ID=MMETSP0167-20121228/8313_1 /TAXON_ID=38298 /ORGANISM="Rhodella maculata, Strain CCMP736" /LENGTH=76 /DNA_ID=CAMNT_0016132301 /DNA_START=1 /DNA_END=231 /DNA_ORIENTATION=-
MHSIKLVLFAIFLFALSAFSMPIHGSSPTTVLAAHGSEMTSAQLHLQDAMLKSGMTVDEIAQNFAAMYSTAVPTPC